MTEIVKSIFKKLDKFEIHFIQLHFTDILGILKSVVIPVEQFEKAVDEGIMFDGSSIKGFVRIEESDMVLKPDPETFLIYPQELENPPTARLICDVYKTDGQNFEGCPRYILKKVLKEANDMGFDFQVGPELEFFLFNKTPANNPLTHTDDQGGYFDLSPVDESEIARKHMVTILRKMGFSIETSHHENSQGQHEIDIRYDNALKTADNILIYKQTITQVASLHNLHATFIPKPIRGINGSGMHLHQSLYKDGKNSFYSKRSKHYNLSKNALYYIGGLMTHARGYSAITNPLINSYKRIVPGYEAPVYISWAKSNRSPLIRIPASSGPNTRIELRNPDPTCNPYLALAVVLKAGLDGIKNKITPPEPMNINIYQLTKEELRRRNIETLPFTLIEALDALKKDEVIRGTLGEHTFHNFIKAKEIEWEIYRTQVSKWELKQYLHKY